MRKGSYRRELSYWCQCISDNEKMLNQKSQTSFSFKDKNYNFFIKLGESIILDKKKSLEEKINNLIILESLRSIKKMSKLDELELLENRFAIIVENENWKI